MPSSRRGSLRSSVTQPGHALFKQPSGQFKGRGQARHRTLQQQPRMSSKAPSSTSPRGYHLFSLHCTRLSHISLIDFFTKAEFSQSETLGCRVSGPFSPVITLSNCFPVQPGSRGAPSLRKFREQAVSILQPQECSTKEQLKKSSLAYFTATTLP